MCCKNLSEQKQKKKNSVPSPESRVDDYNHIKSIIITEYELELSSKITDGASQNAECNSSGYKRKSFRWLKKLY